MSLAFMIAAVLVASPATAPVFAQPLPDAELALATSRVSTTAPAAVIAGRMLLGVNADLSREQIDVWWADDGLLLLASALRPTATLSSFELGDRPSAVQFNGSASGLPLSRP